MAEYIDREAAIDALRRRLGPNTSPAQKNMLQIAAIDIRGIHAADVAPVRHGRWEVVVGSDGKEHMVCTVCRKQQGLTGVFSYCPNCGAKMDEEDGK